MLLLSGVGIIIVVMLFVLFAVWYGKITKSFVIATVVATGIAVGMAITNLPDLAGLIVQAGEKGIYGLRVEKAAQQVRTDTEEVRQMKEQIEALAKRVGQGEQNVAQMYNSMQQTWRSLFESFAYIVSTRNLFPPPDFINQEINRHVNILGAFAYPDPQERNAEIQKVMGNIKKAQGQ